MSSGTCTRLRPMAAVAFAFVIACAIAAGAAAARGRHGLALAAAGALLATVIGVGRRVGRALDADGASRRELEGAMAQQNAELERRSRDLQENLERLTAARTHLGVNDRLAAVGRLAAGVAHGINNPLAVALTNLAWLRETLPGALAPAPERLPGPSAEELLRAVEEAEDAGQRVSGIVRDLQDFAQERAGTSGAADLVASLLHVKRLVASEVRARARLVMELPEAPIFVGGTSARLGQLFAHLLLHAAQSVEEGRPSDNEVRVVARATDRGAEVEVRDTGRALTPEALAHVFDPFYAAWSGNGQDLGLGLAVCHGLAGALGGAITVESSPGHGNAYRVSLPAASSQTRIVLGPATVKAVARRRVLVIDDEPLVCASLYRVLSRYFDVVPHTSPRQALAVVRAGESFDSVLCDVMMPEMSGASFFEELSRLNPALAGQVVFLTGGAFTTGAQDFLERVPNRRLYKPFEPAELVAVLGARGSELSAHR